MERIYRQNYTVAPICVDCYGRLKPSVLLYFAQEIAGEHCIQLGTDWDSLQKAGLFWALIRTKVEITRLPQLGEELTIETWPMPETRTAYPRCTVAYDSHGQECFRILSLWVLMDTENRTMVLPGKSPIHVPGLARGNEPEAPRALPAHGGALSAQRIVGFGELDRNLHMNNTRYLDWVMDLPDVSYHNTHSLKGFTICYFSEARHRQNISLAGALESDILYVDGYREKTDVPGEKERVFAAKLQFG